MLAHRRATLRVSLALTLAIFSRAFYSALRRDMWQTVAWGVTLRCRYTCGGQRFVCALVRDRCNRSCVSNALYPRTAHESFSSHARIQHVSEPFELSRQFNASQPYKRTTTIHSPLTSDTHRRVLHDACPTTQSLQRLFAGACNLLLYLVAEWALNAIRNCFNLRAAR